MSKSNTPKPPDFEGGRLAEDIELEAFEYFDLDGNITEDPTRALFPLGYLSGIAGMSGAMKSTWYCWYTAQATQAGKRVLIANGEDAASATRARIEVHGGDLSKCLVMDQDRTFTFPDDMERFERLVDKFGADIVFIDPIAQALRPSIGNDQAVRQALTPIAGLAGRKKIAVVLVGHTIKHPPKNGSPQQAFPGKGVVNNIRAGYLFGINPGDESERAMATAKFSLGPMPLARTFSAEEDLVTDESGVVVRVAKMALMDDAAKIDPLHVLTKPKDENQGPKAEKRAIAAEWLATFLADNGPTPVNTTEYCKKHGGGKFGSGTPFKKDKVTKDMCCPECGAPAGSGDLVEGLRDLASLDGVTYGTLVRAKDDTGAEHERDGFQGPVWWQLPVGHPNLRDSTPVGPQVVADDDTLPPMTDDDMTITDDDIANLLGGDDA